jgi:tetratricopeptide (TPR) repeat protein
MEKYKKINEKIKKGYDLARKEESAGACEIWLDAWEDIKKVLLEEESKDIESLEKKYEWHQFMTNYIQDLDMELESISQTEDEYLKKRITYCEEMIEVLNDDQGLTKENARRGIAASHYALGDKEECDRLFGQWLSEDPQWGWGYIGWSDCYSFGTRKTEPDYVRAEEIIRMALEKENVRDMEDVFMRGVEIYKELGQNERAKELEREMKRLKRQPNTVVSQARIGRNDPCPCGSGKKYKKCCGKN